MLDSLTVEELTGTIGRPSVGPRDLGRALGRVLAHEIGHVLLGLPSHQPHGLMRRAFHPLDMVNPLRASYDLSPLERARLRHRSERILAGWDRAGLRHDGEAGTDVCYDQRTAEGTRGDRGVEASSHDAGGVADPGCASNGEARQRQSPDPLWSEGPRRTQRFESVSTRIERDGRTGLPGHLRVRVRTDNSVGRVTIKTLILDGAATTGSRARCC